MRRKDGESDKNGGREGKGKRDREKWGGREKGRDERRDRGRIGMRERGKKEDGKGRRKREK